MRPPQRSKALQEVVGFTVLACLCAAWVLFSFFPEGGLSSVAAPALRAAAAAVGLALIGIVLGGLLRIVGLVSWSPGVRSVASWRQRRARQRRELEERRVEAQRAVWRTVESLPKVQPDDSREDVGTRTASGVS